MKNVIPLLLLVFTIVSCGSKKKAADIPDDDSIVYILPVSVTNALKDKLDGNYKDVYFSLIQEDGNYTLYYDYKMSGSKINRWIETSKRKILIDKKLYPLIFGTDETFAVADRYKAIVEGANSGDLQFLQRISVARNRNSIRFKPDGTIIR